MAEDGDKIPAGTTASGAASGHPPADQRQQHDERARLLFSHDRPVRELLAHMGALPAGQEVRLVSWRTEWIALQTDAERVPARLARTLADQVWLVCAMDGRPIRTTLFEFKSDHDADTARQITLYLCDLWQDSRKLAALRTGADAASMRAALIYTGESRWTADLSLPAVEPDGDIAFQPGIFLLDMLRADPGAFPEDSLLARIIPLERCRGRLQWERDVDEAAVVAEMSRQWEGLQLLAGKDASLWPVLTAWLRAGFTGYVRNLNLLDDGDEGMYATMDEAYAARRAEEAQRITERVTERVTASVTASVTRSVTISLLIDYVQGRYGEPAAAAVRDFLTDWDEDARLPSHLEMDKLMELHRDGQDLHAGWEARRQWEPPLNAANGTANSVDT